MHRITKVLYSGAIACSMVAGGVVSASANSIGNEGCTPGFWKNHKAAWQEFLPGQAAGSVFNDGGFTYTDGLTLHEALQGNGGTGLDGAAEILLRAATAAVLNAAHNDVDYPQRRLSADGGFAIISTVNAALQSGDRDAMLELAQRLDRLNNLGCPL